MPAAEVAAAHARRRARLAERLRSEARRAWARVDRRNISASWAAQIPRLLFLLVAAQRDAATAADGYLTAVLAAQGATTGNAGVNPDAFAGIASDGRDLTSLMALPGIVAKTALAAGESLDRAMAAGGALAQLAAHTQVADAGRTADQVALVAQPRAGGYTRMAVGKTCSRCLILAGRRYQWNTGFRRHPKCDCIHIPTAEDAPGDLRTNPRLAFDAMDRAEQDRVFTIAGAQAIRDGADMNQVVNARRGMETASVFGRDVLITTEGTTLRGAFGRAGRDGPLIQRPEQRVRSTARVRLMPEQIYREAAGDRAEAVRLLRRFGYLL